MAEQFPSQADWHPAQPEPIFGPNTSVNPKDTASLEQFKFHQQRFQRKAELENQKRKKPLQKIFHPRGHELTAVDMAHEEALRDNQEWDRKYHPETAEGRYNRELNKEYKEWQKMLDVVTTHIKQKRDNPEGEGKNKRILILALSGGMTGSYGGGQLTALHKMGFNQTFDVAVGISAGACDLAYFLGNEQQALMGSSVYYEECTTQRFLDFKRLHQMMDVSYLTEIMREGKKRLDIEGIQQNPTEFYVQATRRDGSPELINAKHNDKGIVEAVHASMALPLLYGEQVSINEQQYVDGGLDPLPIDAFIDKFQPTDILILPQRPFKLMSEIETSAKRERRLGALIPETRSAPMGTLAMLKKVLKRKEALRSAFQKIKTQKGVNIGILFPPDQGLTTITNDRDEIKAGMLAAAKGACEAFGEPDCVQELHLL